jgi:hypothetical protein
MKRGEDKEESFESETEKKTKKEKFEMVEDDTLMRKDV